MEKGIEGRRMTENEEESEMEGRWERKRSEKVRVGEGCTIW